MAGLSTHVLDTAHGRPAQGLALRLERRTPQGFSELARGTTDADGRVARLLPDGETLTEGVYRLTFETGAWLDAQGLEGFYPQAAVVFEVADASQHYHVPLLLSPYGYSTYRGS